MIMRKSIKDISWLVDESTYRGDTAISYSILSRYDRDGFRNLRIVTIKNMFTLN